MFATFNFIDFATGMLGIFKDKKQNDIWKFQSGTGIEPRKIKVAAVCFVAGFGAFVLGNDWLLLKGVI
jgi:hypothetical protein